MYYIQDIFTKIHATVAVTSYHHGEVQKYINCEFSYHYIIEL